MYNIVYFIDYPSILSIIIITFPMLAASGLLKDFFNSFKYITHKNLSVPVKDLKKSLSAVKLVMSLVLFSGILVTLVSWVVILRSQLTLQLLCVNFAVSILTLLYSIFLEILLLPVKVRLEIRLYESEE